MEARRWVLAGLFLCGCGAPDAGGPADAAPDGAAPIDASMPADAGAIAHTLGLNDVTMLVPLPQAPAIVLLRGADPADDGTPLVPRALYDTLNDIPNRGPTLFQDIYPDLQVFAVRFDLCDRIAPGPCPDSDGRLRLVFQAMRAGTPAATVDAAFHAFYLIPKADLPQVVTELRALAALQGADPTSALTVNPALVASTSGEYATRLKKLITHYAGSNSIQRLTFFAQPDMFAQIRWVFRGVELQNGSFVDITIPGGSATLQEVIFSGTSSFDVMPVADQPAGFSLAVDETAFAAAPPASQAGALEALATANNPLLATPNTIQCADCHVATHLMQLRGAAAGIDPNTLASRYAAPPYDLSEPPISDRTLRALGWLGSTPLIALRSANESAQVAIEMDTRFPAP